MLLSKKDLCSILGISTQTMTRYITDGMGGQVGKGPATKYDAAKVIDFHIAKRVEQSIKFSRSTTPDLEGVPEQEVSERLSAHWKQERDRMNTLKAAKELIPMAVSEREINAKVTQIRGGIDSIPGMWASDIINIETPEQAQRTLTKLTQSLLAHLVQLPDIEIEDEDVPNEDTED